MAEVFEAELAGDLGFVRKVAIKRMLDSAAADPSCAKRFLDEAVIASRLHHANVISVVDLGLLDDRPFQVLEYVDGIDAQHLLQRAGGKLPLEIALAIASDVAHALDHAHTAVDADGLPLGIVHRDVKPSNVLLSWGGDVKLGDFGIATAHDRAATTEVGVVAGTRGFIAPEQRQRGALDGRTDVFALGLTLHALVAGRSPMSDLEVEMAVLAGDAVPLDPSLPDDIRAILSRALAVTRTDRPTAGELAAQLGAALAPRLAGDRRTVLRAFLAGHAPRPVSRPGALDGLLGIEVVEAGGSGDEIHRYATRGASTAAVPAPHDPTSATVPNAPDARTAPSTREAAPRRSRVLPIGIAIGLGAAGTLVAWKLRGGGGPAEAPRDAAAIVVADPPALDAPDDTAVASDAPVAELADAAIADGRRLAPHPDARTRPPAVRDAAIAVPETRPTGTGYLQVLGEDLIGASVIVDGANLGSVPNVFAVALGSHRVEVERRDGTRLPARSIEVTATNNRANPAHPRW